MSQANLSVPFHSDPTPSRARVHVFIRLALLAAVGSIGCSSVYWLLYLALPAWAAPLISQKGSERYLRENAPGMVRVLDWVAAAYAHCSRPVERLRGSGHERDQQHARQRTAALTALLGAIAGVSLLVGGIGIMNIMLVSVTERAREIGLHLAIGARGGEVLMPFLIEAVAISTLGGALGIVFGRGASFAATQALKMPLLLSLDIVLIAAGFSATIGVGFGFFPARKAARLNPIEALRHE